MFDLPELNQNHFSGFLFLICSSIMGQVPGTTSYSLALYYMMSTPLKDAPLLEAFVKGDDTYRNSRFKLIPYISKVSIDLHSFSIDCKFALFVEDHSRKSVLIYKFWFLGIMDSEAKCGKESLLDRPSIGN